MLTLTLRRLERDGLITRRLTPTIPPRVDYRLTELGQTLFEPLTALAMWAEQHREAIRSAKRRYDAQLRRQPQYLVGPFNDATSDVRPRRRRTSAT